MEKITTTRKMTSMFSSLMLIILLLCMLILSPQQKNLAAPAILPWLKTSGNQIVTIDNRKVTLRGVNLLRNEWVYPDMTFEEAAIPTIARDWHANLITHGFAANPVNANDPTYLGVLDEYVNLATNNGMYINLVYYYDDINGDQPPMPTQAAQDALVKLVARYKQHSNVMFQLQAEPHDSIWWDQSRTDQLLPIFNRMVTAMRAVDNPAPYKHLIIAPGDGWGRDVSLAVTHPITADNEINIVYSTHPYDPQSEWGYFLDAFNGGKPVIITEFGTGTQMSQADTLALMALARVNNIPWTAWTFDTEGPPTLLSGNRMNFTPSTPYGLSVKTEMIATAQIPSSLQLNNHTYLVFATGNHGRGW